MEGTPRKAEAPGSTHWEPEPGPLAAGRAALEPQPGPVLFPNGSIVDEFEDEDYDHEDHIPESAFLQPVDPPPRTASVAALASAASAAAAAAAAHERRPTVDEFEDDDYEHEDRIPASALAQPVDPPMRTSSVAAPAPGTLPVPAVPVPAVGELTAAPGSSLPGPWDMTPAALRRFGEERPHELEEGHVRPGVISRFPHDLESFLATRADVGVSPKAEFYFLS